MPFMQFWAALNRALSMRGEPDALFGEARDWFGWRIVRTVDERLVNRVINARRPL